MRIVGHRRLLQLAVVAAGSIILAYIFGNQGIEAFFATYIAAGATFSVYLWFIVENLFRSRHWLIVKLLGIVVLLFVLLVLGTAILMFVSEPNINPRIEVPTPNWLLVVPCALAIVVSALPKRVYLRTLTINELVVRDVATLLTIVLMFVAYIVFSSMESQFRTLVLVITVQMQYIANYVAVETPYFKNTHLLLDTFFAKSGIRSEGRLALVLYMLVLSMPFTVPLALIMIMGNS